MRILCIDVETTGVDPNLDKVVELGWAELEYSEIDTIHQIIDFGGSLINPERDVPPEASAIHHLVEGDLIDAPVMSEALKLLPKADVYVAHNAKFDAAFLPPSFGPWVCTYKSAIKIRPEFPSFGLQYLRYKIGLRVKHLNKDAPMHRALSDALVLAALLKRMLLEQDIETLIQWTTEPIFLPRFAFGKHAGVDISDIDSGYLHWILKSDFEENVEYTARTELARRKAEGATHKITTG